ncbi:hypothetical protein Leryth_025498 [Lithospermum erythrorhizon]|nr:hypothetical protein Leryth_025498 [Lithospermum erythrorhizon]
MFSLILKLCLALLIPRLDAMLPVEYVGSRSILRTIETNIKNDGNREYGIEVNATNFDDVFRETPATYAVVEFFAHWCPACRNYKPQYEKVARLFNGADAIHPGIILMARVDCANKINSKLCDKFSIEHFPMLFWGPAAKFVSGSWKRKQENSAIHLIDEWRTADLLLNWINKQLGSSYGLEDVTYENEHVQTNTTDLQQIARAVYDVEEATATAFEIITEHKMIKSETRASLINFLQILVAHHPSRRCRKGSAEILVNFDTLNPSKVWSRGTLQLFRDKKVAMSDHQICGKDIPRGYWMFCRGSKNDTRGFSCGLWVLLHSLSVRIDDGESQNTFKSTCNFIHDFFVCEECRQHFHEMCSSVSKPFEKARDFVLWLWEAHNEVNERLMKDEASFRTGDPKFPKVIFPPKQLCPSCYSSEPKNGNRNISWDHDEVYRFLTNYYGEVLVSEYKDKDSLPNVETGKLAEELVASPNSVVVPFGAALGIAAASCGFGALAWLWRSRQKSRKPRRSWN